MLLAPTASSSSTLGIHHLMGEESSGAATVSSLTSSNRTSSSLHVTSRTTRENCNAEDGPARSSSLRSRIINSPVATQSDVPSLIAQLVAPSCPSSEAISCSSDENTIHNATGTPLFTEAVVHPIWDSSKQCEDKNSQHQSSEKNQFKRRTLTVIATTDDEAKRSSLSLTTASSDNSTYSSSPTPPTTQSTLIEVPRLRSCLREGRQRRRHNRRTPRRVRGIWGTGDNSRNGSNLFANLYDEQITTIFAHLSMKDLCLVSMVCRRFRHLSQQEDVWKRIDATEFVHDVHSHYVRTNSNTCNHQGSRTSATEGTLTNADTMATANDTAATKFTSADLAARMEQYSPNTLSICSIEHRLSADNFLSSLPCLQELTLTYFYDLTDTNLHVLFLSSSFHHQAQKAVSKQQTCRLRKLVLEHCVRLTDATVRSIGKLCPELEELSLQGNPKIQDISPLEELWTLVKLPCSFASASRIENPNTSVTSLFAAGQSVANPEATTKVANSMASLFTPPLHSASTSMSQHQPFLTQVANSMESLFSPPPQPAAATMMSPPKPLSSFSNSMESLFCPPLQPPSTLIPKPQPCNAMSSLFSPPPQPRSSLLSPPKPRSSNSMSSLFSPPPQPALTLTPSPKPQSCTAMASLFSPPPQSASTLSPKHRPSNSMTALVSPPQQPASHKPRPSTPSSALQSLFAPPGQSPRRASKAMNDIPPQPFIRRSSRSKDTVPGRLVALNISDTGVTPTSMIQVLKKVTNGFTESHRIHLEKFRMNCTASNSGSKSSWNDVLLLEMMESLDTNKLQCLELASSAGDGQISDKGVDTLLTRNVSSLRRINISGHAKITNRGIAKIMTALNATPDNFIVE